MTRCCANSISTGWSTSSKSLPTPGSFALPGLRWQENEPTENERETPCYRREHNSRHRGANAFAAGADQVADILAASATSMAGSAAGRLRPWHLQQKDCRYRLAGRSGEMTNRNGPRPSGLKTRTDRWSCRKAVRAPTANVGFDPSTALVD